MTASGYREKYKRLGMCVSHPKVKAMLGHVHCEQCVMKRRKGGICYKDSRYTREILGVRVMLGLLQRLLP